MPEITGTCDTCAFFEREGIAYNNRPVNRGECRIRSVPSAHFPLRKHTDWCGEHATEDTPTIIQALQDISNGLSAIALSCMD